MKARLVLALLTASAGMLPSGCVPDAPPRVELASGTVAAERLAVVLWVDGLDILRFEQLRNAGRLPNITRYLIDRGVTVRGAVACLPTITYANNVSFHTGLFPGHHGIVGNKWFDPYSLILRDYNSTRTYQQVDGDFTAPTIYEVLRDEPTATILTPVRRGAGRNIDNWASAGVAWFFGLQSTVNHLTTLRFELIADVANRTGRWPTLILAYFVTPDTVAHKCGVSSKQYTDIVVDVDRQVGHVCRALEKAGLLERTYVTLVTDHGFVDAPNHTDVARYFRKELKVPTISKPFGRGVPLERRAAHFAKARAVVVTGGNRRCSIHLRAGEHWWQRPTEAQIDRFATALSSRRGAGLPPSAGLPAILARLPAVETVMVRLGENAVRVQSRAGSGRIDRVVRGRRKLYRYRVTAGTDPLGYASNDGAAALMDGEHHDMDAWLAATLSASKPDVVPQLIELNDSPRSGDINLFAADGWDFASADRAGHGGLLRREIVVPWIWTGPDLPAKASITGARIVDLMPTILHLIGRGERVRAGLDGKSIAERLKRAGPGGASPSGASR